MLILETMTKGNEKAQKVLSETRQMGTGKGRPRKE